MAIANIDAEVAERLELPVGPYSTDSALLEPMLDAMIRHGWRPTLDYDQFTAMWHVMLRHGSTMEFHHAQHESVAKAVVGACLEALKDRAWVGWR